MNVRAKFVNGPNEGKVQVLPGYRATVEVAVVAPLPDTIRYYTATEMYDRFTACHRVLYRCLGSDFRDRDLFYYAVASDTRDDEVKRLRRENENYRRTNQALLTRIDKAKAELR